MSKISNIRIFTFQEWENKEMTSYVTYIVLYISLTFNIFILCYIGELVAEKVKFLCSNLKYSSVPLINLMSNLNIFSRYFYNSRNRILILTKFTKFIIYFKKLFLAT